MVAEFRHGLRLGKVRVIQTYMIYTKVFVDGVYTPMLALTHTHACFLYTLDDEI